MRLHAIAAATLAAIATPAVAQDAATDAQQTGLSVTLVGGYDHFTSDGTDIGGALGGVAVGYDVAMSGFILGGEAEATFATTDLCDGTVCFEASRDLYAGARAGFAIGEGALLYAKGGYTNARAVVTVDGDRLGSSTEDGYRLGGGLEGTSGRFLARLEYRYSDYGQDDNRHQAVVGVGYRF